MDFEIFETKEFLNALKAMKRVGGRKAKAANQVFAMRGSIGLSDDPLKSLRKTKHGETRIAGCVKYDLTDFCRLVTLVGNGCIFLLYVGDHDDADAWLERNRGLTLGAVSGELLGRTKVSDQNSGLMLENAPDNWSGVLIERLPDDLFTRLLGDLPVKEGKLLLEVRAGSTDEIIDSALAQVRDPSLRSALRDILILLNTGVIEDAKNRALLYLGDFTPIAELSAEEILELDLGDGVRKVQLGSKEYATWVSRFMETSHPFDWFLFMHPEQEKHVATNYAGPAKLSGVTGSGKTSIAVKRAVRLASEYEGDKILVISLNRALCEFISEIVDHACGPDTDLRNRIEVNSLFAICQSLLKEFEPTNSKHYNDITWGLEEHKDEVYREFYRCLSNVKDAEVLRPMHRLLMSQDIDAERYIAEEFDWIRSALPRGDRSKYNSINRQGRGYKILEQHRPAILEGLAGWERKMSAVGVIDYMGLVTAVTRYMDQVVPRYRSIIVDEVQDFGSVELSITVCEWLAKLDLAVSEWSDFVDTDDLVAIGIPGFLHEFPDAETLNLRELTGSEFSFTPYARGLDVELQERLEEFVDGRGLIQAGTQRRLRWKSMGALLDDLESGAGTGGALGPVARDVIKSRLLQASLGLRPSIKSRPGKRVSLPSSIGPAAPPVQAEGPLLEVELQHDLDLIDLTVRQKLILRSLNIKTLDELSHANERQLERYFTKVVIAELKSKAEKLKERVELVKPVETLLGSVGFSDHTVAILKQRGLRRLGELSMFSKSDLWSISGLGGAEVQKIFRICRDHGVKLKGEQ